MRSYKPFVVGLCVTALIVSVTTSAPAAEFAQRYRATLDFSESRKGYEWTTGPEESWRLNEFDYSLGDAFHVKLGPSQVVFGCHESNVVWAAVFPDEPGQIVAAPQGKGEHATSIWLRFNPARLEELFPERIVARQGNPATVSRTKRLAMHKLIASWQSGGLPMIPWKKSVTFDMETREGSRRFYSLDMETGHVEYVDAFRAGTLPVPKPIDPKTALTAFDEVWSAFDREYAMFAIKPRVDWNKLRQTYRPRAAVAKDNNELAAIIAEMLDHLEDLHVYVAVDNSYVPGYNRPRFLNANPAALPRFVHKITETGRGLHWGRIDDGIGYINIDRLSDDALPQTFDEAIEQMGKAKGLILDLRYNGGGSEPLGCQIAGRLLDRPRTYSLSQFRNGPKHTDLGPKDERSCGPDGPWRFLGPVVVLQGQKTMSSAESFALALAQCPQVTTMGDRTAGSSGNPRRLDAGAGIIVNLPRWIDMDPHGKPIDAVGIPPQVKIEAVAADFKGDRDPVLAAALENLKRRLKTEKPPAGGVLAAPAWRSAAQGPAEGNLGVSGAGRRGRQTAYGHPYSVRPPDGSRQHFLRDRRPGQQRVSLAADAAVPS